MLAELKMVLDTGEEKLGYAQASLLHGVIMEKVSSEYAEKIHSDSLHSYSQSIYFDGHPVWVIKTFDKEAYTNIIMCLMDDSFDSFLIKKLELNVKILNKSINIKPKKDLMNNFYNEEVSKFIDLEFITPTAFKSDGKYVIFPELNLFYKSLMKKYRESSDMEMLDYDTLEQLCLNSSIVRYNLKTCYFPLEGVRIPAFKGTISIKMHGNETLSKYAKLLCEFAEYSGVGIKTGMGMGMIKLGYKGKEGMKE